jgi:hypothetical protein
MNPMEDTAVPGIICTTTDPGGTNYPLQAMPLRSIKTYRQVRFEFVSVHCICGLPHHSFSPELIEYARQSGVPEMVDGDYPAPWILLDYETETGDEVFVAPTWPLEADQLVAVEEFGESLDERLCAILGWGDEAIEQSFADQLRRSPRSLHHELWSTGGGLPEPAAAQRTTPCPRANCACRVPLS